MPAFAHYCVVSRTLAAADAQTRDAVLEVRLVLRLDAGFATEANLAWLWEMGYTVLSKVHGLPVESERKIPIIENVYELPALTMAFTAADWQRT